MDGRRMLALVGLLLSAGVLAGCTSDSSPASSTVGQAADNEAAAPAAPGQPAPAEGGGSGGVDQPGKDGAPPARQEVSQPGVDRRLIRTASLELESPEVIDVANRARDIAVNLGGFAGQEEVRGDSAAITLHVPSDRFDQALGQLSGLVPAERIKSRNTTAEDVTEQLVDVESRIITQRASVDRVRALLARAQSVDEIVRIEGEVTRREADLESLERRRAALTGQVALSRVTVRVTRGEAPPPAAEEDDPGGFLAGLAGGWRAFVDTGGAVLRVLGAVLPFLVVLGVPGVYALRWWRRRRVAQAGP